MDIIRPTNATRTAAYAVVGVAAALVVPKLTGKGIGGAAIGAIVAVLLHELLDAPVAKAMVSIGVQL